MTMAQDGPYFRAQAERARAEAESATLDNVRDRALRSVAAFEAMAVSAEGILTRRIEREAKVGTYGQAEPVADLVEAD